MRLPSIAQRGEGRAGGWEWGVEATVWGSPGMQRDVEGRANYLPRVPNTAAPIIIAAASAMLQLSTRPLTSINSAVEHSGVR